jgi:crotonobetainyl-CoA:carnitine CoA-transferase CaiB-like acyl-CoA transferase
VSQANGLPLSGVRVVEFCQIAAGPFCGMLLADLGADVIKVEAPEGDGLRNWPPHTGGYSENFASLNRNKRSVVFDLKLAEDRAAARALCLDADVVVENFRPGVLAKFGLGWPDLSALKPTLIYASISAYGQTGPRSQEGGFDLTIQAAAGVMSVTGEPDGAPVKCGVPLADFSSGLYAAYVIAATLAQVRAGGHGEHIDVSLLGSTLGIAALQTSEYFGSGANPRKLGSAHPRNAPYQAFRAKDGWFAMAAGNDKLWRSALEPLGRPDLADDPRFGSTSLRAKNQVELRDILESEFARFTAAELLKTYADLGVPAAPIAGYAEALAEPQVAHMGWVQPIDLPGGETTRTFVFPARLSGRTPGVYRRPPALGEHTQDVKQELAARRRP